MQKLMMLTLVDNPSASKRLQAVSYATEITDAGNEVIDALMTTLNEDANVNVRLAALEALMKFSEEPRVREGLVKSIVQQKSPLVQSAMVDIMLKLQEKKSVQPLRELLNTKDLNQSVKVKIERSIPQLI
jgi:HEAT repeat protein